MWGLCWGLCEGHCLAATPPRLCALCVHLLEGEGDVAHGADGTVVYLEHLVLTLQMLHVCRLLIVEFLGKWIKKYVLWGLKALGNNLCKSSNLKAGGNKFSAVCLMAMVGNVWSWVVWGKSLMRMKS